MQQQDIIRYCNEELFQTVINIYWMINSKKINSKIKTTMEDILANAMDIDSYCSAVKIEFDNYYSCLSSKIGSCKRELISNYKDNSLYTPLVIEIKVLEAKLNRIANYKTGLLE